MSTIHPSKWILSNNLSFFLDGDILILDIDEDYSYDSRIREAYLKYVEEKGVAPIIGYVVRKVGYYADHPNYENFEFGQVIGIKLSWYKRKARKDKKQFILSELKKGLGVDLEKERNRPLAPKAFIKAAYYIRACEKNEIDFETFKNSLDLRTRFLYETFLTQPDEVESLFSFFNDVIYWPHEDPIPALVLFCYISYCKTKGITPVLVKGESIIFPLAQKEKIAQVIKYVKEKETNQNAVFRVGPDVIVPFKEEILELVRV